MHFVHVCCAVTPRNKTLIQLNLCLMYFREIKTLQLELNEKESQLDNEKKVSSDIELCCDEQITNVKGYFYDSCESQYLVYR